jgi:UDP-glucuronate 4-epimerase
MAELVGTLERALGCSARTALHPAQPGDPRVLYASVERAERELGYRPVVDLEVGVGRFANWYLARPTRNVLADRGLPGS